MTIDQLEQLADQAISRWQNPNLPALPGNPSVKICSPGGTLEILPGLAATKLGTNKRGMHVLLVDAAKLKQAIERYRAEFAIER